MKKQFKIGDIVKHYKGNYYQIVGFATHTETVEDLIIYRLYNIENNIIDNSKYWARPIKMFNDIVDDKNNTKRFIKVSL